MRFPKLPNILLQRVRLVAVTLSAIGMLLGFAVARTMLERSLQRAIQEIPPPDIVLRRRAQDYLENNRPQAAFRALQRAIDASPTPARRNANALVMAIFLVEQIDDSDGIFARDRFRMAREYLMALVDTGAATGDRIRMVRLMLRVALELEDIALWQHSETLLAVLPGVVRVPFSIEADRFDAAVSLAPTPGAISSGLERMAAAIRNRDEMLAYRRRRLRTMRWAIEDYDWPVVKPEVAGELQVIADPDKLIERFEFEIAGLLDSSDPATSAEAYLHKAFLAARRQDFDAEIRALKTASRRHRDVLRAGDYARLLDLLQETQRDEQTYVLLGEMLKKPAMRTAALNALKKLLDGADDPDRVVALFELLDSYLELQPDDPRMGQTVMLCAARVALDYERFADADRYLAAAADDTDWRVRAEASMLSAESASRQGDTNMVMRQVLRTIALYPGHPREFDARFKWIDLVAHLPYAEADLIGGAIGALIRRPDDDRALDGLMLVAERLERYGLSRLAESYFRRAVIQGSIRSDGRPARQAAEATLGQARVLIAMERDVEADRLLRALNANEHWSRVWPESGPLWASIAVRQGQFEEAVRRWRQVCGPPNDPVLAELFGVLVPDPTDLEVRMPIVARRPPSKAPADMSLAVADAAVKRMVRDGDMDRLQRVISMMEQEPYWRSRAPLEEYRLNRLGYVLAQEPMTNMLQRMTDIGLVDAERGRHSLHELVSGVENVTARARETTF